MHGYNVGEFHAKALELLSALHGPKGVGDHAKQVVILRRAVSKSDMLRHLFSPYVSVDAPCWRYHLLRLISCALDLGWSWTC